MHVLARLIAAGLCAAAAATAAQAQVRQIAPSAKPATPSASTRAANATPNPSGLRPIFPAGVNSGSGAAVSTDPVANTTAPVPATSTASTTRTTAGGTVVTGTTVPAELPPANGSTTTTTTATTTAEGAVATNVLGAGPTVPGPAQYLGSGAGGVAAADIARSFYQADANHDGELTRAEFRRLGIATLSFEEMDRNFDGVISRFEYEDSFR